MTRSLDYFEADPSLRTEDNAFFDEEKVKAELESALNNIKSFAGCQLEVKG